MMHDGAGLTFAEIGHILGIKEAAARQRYHRAKEEFKECWEKQGGNKQ
jgi:DNA-directed RNA polymerase specialized sigma24 family protein